MKPHDVMDNETLELAALHAFGELDGETASAFERHLETCSPCRAEVLHLRATIVELGHAVATPPPDGLRARLLARVARPQVVDAVVGDARVGDTGDEHPRDGRDVSPQAWRNWTSDVLSSSLTLLSADSTGWEATSIDGIAARRLFVDAVADRVTMLVRMAPGTAYPPHVHGGPEECYVLAGDLRVGDGVVLTAGSYQRMPGGSAHPVQSTRDGCLLLLTSSAHDELLPQRA